MITLIVGGARSGKSSLASRLAQEWVSNQGRGQLHHVATAIPFDDEMTLRIKHHQRRRGTPWNSHEAHYDLEQVLIQFGADDVVVIDCLILWLNNLLFESCDMQDVEKVKLRIESLLDVLASTEAKVILVSNEVGMGVVPSGDLSQRFALLAGFMNQRVANLASNVVLVAAGLSITLKGTIDSSNE